MEGFGRNLFEYDWDVGHAADIRMMNRGKVGDNLLMGWYNGVNSTSYTTRYVATNSEVILYSDWRYVGPTNALIPLSAIPSAPTMVTMSSSSMSSYSSAVSSGEVKGMNVLFSDGSSIVLSNKALNGITTKSGDNDVSMKIIRATSSNMNAA